MEEKTADYVVELRFSDEVTLKELLLELLIEKIGLITAVSGIVLKGESIE